jgi:hypothetical protein
MAQLSQIANNIPQELIPSDLSYDSIKTIYNAKLSELESSGGHDKGLTDDEKPAERAVEKLTLANETIANYLNRDDLKASMARKNLIIQSLKL